MSSIHKEVSGKTNSSFAMNDLFRYPHTPHIAWLGAVDPRDDKVMSPSSVALLLADKVVVEEKLDGANLGFSIGSDGSLRAQNRGQYLLPPFVGQFARLGHWLDMHRDQLLETLGASLIIFGEWCAARHSLDYDYLPDWWLFFDVYDREAKKFWSTERRHQTAREIGVVEVPCLRRGLVKFVELNDLVTHQISRFGEEPIEGLVVRREDSAWLHQSGKLVRPSFTQSITQHWRARTMTWNRLGMTPSG